MGIYPWMETLFNWCQFLPSSFIRIKNSNRNTNISFLWTEHNNSKTYLEEKTVENKQNIFMKETVMKIHSSLICKYISYLKENHLKLVQE